MCRKGLSVVAEHPVGVAVVSGEQRRAAHFKYLVGDALYALVHDVHGLYRRGYHARVAHHVAVGKVEYHHVVFARAQFLYHLVRHKVGAHFGLQVVGGHLGRGYQVAHFAGVGRLYAAVEEEGNVRVLLRLGNAQLLHAKGGDVFAQRVLYVFFGEGYLYAGELRVVNGEADVSRFKEAGLSFKGRALGHHEFALRNGAGDLPGPVGAEVEEYHAVALFQKPHGPAVFVYLGGLYKLVCHAILIARFQGVRGVFALYSLAEGEHVVCLFHAVPVVVAVHCVISAAHRGYLAAAYPVYLCLQRAHEARAGGGGNVPAVGKAVHEHVFQSPSLCHLQKGIQVGDVAVHAAVGEQPVKVQLFAVLLCVIHGLYKGGIFKKVAVRYGFGYPRQILVNYPARAHVQVADFAVAHLPVGQAHRKPARAKGGGGVFFCKRFNVLAAVKLDGVAGARGRQPVAVHNDYSVRFFCHKNSS